MSEHYLIFHRSMTMIIMEKQAKRTVKHGGFKEWYMGHVQTTRIQYKLGMVDASFNFIKDRLMCDCHLTYEGNSKGNEVLLIKFMLVESDRDRASTTKSFTIEPHGPCTSMFLHLIMHFLSIKKV